MHPYHYITLHNSAYAKKTGVTAKKVKYITLHYNTIQYRTCIHAYMHTCIHTYIHTYIQTCELV